MGLSRRGPPEILVCSCRMMCPSSDQAWSRCGSWLPRGPCRPEEAVGGPACVPGAPDSSAGVGTVASLCDVPAAAGGGGQKRRARCQAMWRLLVVFGNPCLVLSEIRRPCLTEAGLIKGRLRFQDVLKCVGRTKDLSLLISSSPTTLPS